MVSSSKAYLLKLGKNLPRDFEVIYIFFFVKFGFKYTPISRTFLTYNKINNNYQNFDQLLLRMPKIIENS